MKRIRHAAMGMLVGWLALQITTFLVIFCANLFAHGRHGVLDFPRLVGDAGGFFIMFGFCSAVICLIAWWFLYLPAYWWCPRSQEGWKGGFILTGVAVSSVIGFLFDLYLLLHDRELLEMRGLAVSILLMPVLVGTVSAWAGWWFEEKERRFMDWERRVTPR